MHVLLLSMRVFPTSMPEHDLMGHLSSAGHVTVSQFKCAKAHPKPLCCKDTTQTYVESESTRTQYDALQENEHLESSKNTRDAQQRLQHNPQGFQFY